MDDVVAWTSGIAFIIFLIDLVLHSSMDRKQVYSFFWWMDLVCATFGCDSPQSLSVSPPLIHTRCLTSPLQVATFSVLIDIPWVLESALSMFNGVCYVVSSKQHHLAAVLTHSTLRSFVYPPQDKAIVDAGSAARAGSRMGRVLRIIRVRTML